MSAVVFRDPVFDGPTDPTVIRRGSEWWMFYTQRRVTADEPGVAWVHGTKIGRAVSTDAGATWQYRGTLDDLDVDGNTHWAPEIIEHDGTYRMYLTMIEGIHDRWDGIDRVIREFSSPDLEHWTLVQTLDLSSRLVIDAAVALCGDGLYRLWYKEEADYESRTWAATSPDLAQWTVEGPAVGIPAHEGPNVFELGGWFWMITDEWHGLAVHRSVDGVEWTRQVANGGMILDQPGEHPDDRQWGHHADVVVQPASAELPEHAIAFYFTHPNWDPDSGGDPNAIESRRSTIHVARLTVVDDVLLCDRNVPATLALR